MLIVDRFDLMISRIDYFYRLISNNGLVTQLDQSLRLLLLNSGTPHLIKIIHF